MKMVLTGYIDLEICLEGMVKLVVTGYGLGEMYGGLGQTGYKQLQTWRNVCRFGKTCYNQLQTWRNICFFKRFCKTGYNQL